MRSLAWKPMLGQPDGHGTELCASNWNTAEACARELAASLGVELSTLYAPSASSSIAFTATVTTRARVQPRRSDMAS